MKSLFIGIIIFFISSSIFAHQENTRYYSLRGIAKAEVNEDVKNAKKLAEELLRLSSTEAKDWNYGNALHDGNMVLGQVALREGDVVKAEEYLLKSGSTPGSPQLNSFGPNMSLAQELIQAERVDAVLEYFELCSEFWINSRGRLKTWATQAKAGKMPDFGANLFY